MKQTIAFFLSLILVLTSLPLSTLKISASPFMGGDGSEANPYLVGTPEALNAVRDYPQAHFRQTADIDMSSIENWIPIPNFRGVYDGREHSISYLKIKAQDTSTYASSYGFFASASGTIKKVILKDIEYNITKIATDAYVYGGADYTLYVGGICGSSGRIENCSVSGNITINATTAFVGGICGFNNSEITGCVNTAKLTVNLNENSVCGGICGSNNDKITLSTNAGAIDATSNKSLNVGGICGINESGRIQNCVNTGNLLCVNENHYQGSFYTGGIVGSRGSIKQCVNYGNITAIGAISKSDDNKYSSWTVGGVLGYCNEQFESGAESCVNLARNIFSSYNNRGILISLNTASRINGYVTLGGMGNYTPSFDNCYSLDETQINEKTVTPPAQESMELKKQGKSITSAESLIESSYHGFDFTNIWIIDKNVGGAILRNHPNKIEIDNEIQLPGITEDSLPPFDELLFRAQYLTENLLTDKAYNDLLLTYQGSPSKIIVEASGDMLFYSANAWRNITETMELVTDGNLDIVTRNLQEKDLIIAYIMQALKMQKEVMALDTLKNSSESLIDIVTKSSDLINALNATGEDFQEFAKNHTSEISDIFIDYYESQNSPLISWAKSAAMMEILETFIEGAQDWWDLYAKIDSYAKLYVANDSTKQSLWLMFENCPSEAKSMKWALSSLIEVMSAASDEALQDILNREFSSSCMKQGLDYWADQTWEKLNEQICIKYPNAYLAMQMYEHGLYYIDKFTKADSTTEQYFKLCIMKDLDYLAGAAVSDALDNYNSKSTAFNAEVLLATIELKFAIIDIDFEESITYCEKISDRNIIDTIRSILGTNTGENLKSKLTELKKSIDTMHYSVQAEWIHELKEERPDIAAKYTEYLAQAKKQFPNRNYTVHCPVNVSVYDTSGKLVAEVGEDKVWSSGEIAVVYDHGEKDIYFFDNSEYRIVCEGYDAGDMDISITNYDSDGNITQTVNYNNVPVASGSMHTLSEEQVTDGNGALLEVDFDSTAGAEKHKITISYGVIEGYLAEHEAAKGERVEIYAIIPEGYRFVGWVGEVEFEDAKASSTYFFMPDSDITVSAKLKKIENDDGEDDENDNGVLRVIIIICACGAGVVILAGTAILIITIKKRKIIVSKEKQQ